MQDRLTELLARLHARPMADTEREEQRRSFAYGNAHIENAAITRPLIDREADALAASGPV